MSLWRARLTLLSIFAGSWLANSLILLHFRSVMESSQREQLFSTLATIHSVPLGVLIGGIFAQLTPTKRSAPPSVVWTAILLSVGWVVLVAECWVPYPNPDYVAANLIEALNRRSTEVSFLIAGALTYFSTKAK